MIHEDDIIAMIPKLPELASVPAPRSIGPASSSTFQTGAYLRISLVGRGARRAIMLRGNPLDVTGMHELIGTTTVDWRDGMRHMAKFHPELVAL